MKAFQTLLLILLTIDSLLSSANQLIGSYDQDSGDGTARSATLDCSGKADESLLELPSLGFNGGVLGEDSPASMAAKQRKSLKSMECFAAKLVPPDPGASVDQGIRVGFDRLAEHKPAALSPASTCKYWAKRHGLNSVITVMAEDHGNEERNRQYQIQAVQEANKGQRHFMYEGIGHDDPLSSHRFLESLRHAEPLKLSITGTRGADDSSLLTLTMMSRIADSYQMGNSLDALRNLCLATMTNARLGSLLMDYLSNPLPSPAYNEWIRHLVSMSRDSINNSPQMECRSDAIKKMSGSFAIDQASHLKGLDHNEDLSILIRGTVDHLAKSILPFVSLKAQSVLNRIVINKKSFVDVGSFNQISEITIDERTRSIAENVLAEFCSPDMPSINVVVGAIHAPGVAVLLKDAFSKLGLPEANITIATHFDGSQPERPIQQGSHSTD